MQGWGGRDLQSCGAISWWPLGGVGGGGGGGRQGWAGERGRGGQGQRGKVRAPVTVSGMWCRVTLTPRVGLWAGGTGRAQATTQTLKASPLLLEARGDVG